jgi:hypothetical protein
MEYEPTKQSEIPGLLDLTTEEIGGEIIACSSCGRPERHFEDMAGRSSFETEAR